MECRCCSKPVLTFIYNSLEDFRLLLTSGCFLEEGGLSGSFLLELWGLGCFSCIAICLIGSSFYDSLGRDLVR